MPIGGGPPPILPIVMRNGIGLGLGNVGGNVGGVVGNGLARGGCRHVRLRAMSQWLMCPTGATTDEQRASGACATRNDQQEPMANGRAVVNEMDAMEGWCSNAAANAIAGLCVECSACEGEAPPRQFEMHQRRRDGGARGARRTAKCCNAAPSACWRSWPRREADAWHQAPPLNEDELAQPAMPTERPHLRAAMQQQRQASNATGQAPWRK